jgi:1-acyl-sn-glycerol-3-phosphate acyltransferase
MWYRTAQILVRTGWRLFGSLEVEGESNVPESGPFFLIANHQSYLDPILIQAAVRRPVYTMAKSTQFSYRLAGAIMKSLNSFPVRRFEIDPQAVRLALRYLEQGKGVGIYIEGERSWDARLQPPRIGSVRLVLKAGVPVVPCGISGAYDVWPRWSSGPRRGNVRIRLGEPLRFPRLDDRVEREAAVPEARGRIMAALSELSGSPRAGQ